MIVALLLELFAIGCLYGVTNCVCSVVAIHPNMSSYWNGVPGLGVAQHGINMVADNEALDVISGGGGKRNDNQMIDELVVKDETHAFVSVYKACHLSRGSFVLLISLMKGTKSYTWFQYLENWACRLPCKCFILYASRYSLPVVNAWLNSFIKLGVVGDLCRHNAHMTSHWWFIE